MKRLIVAAVALALAVGLQPQAAQAQPNNSNSGWNTLWYWISHGQPFPLVLSGWIVGAGSGAASYVLTEKRNWPRKQLSWGAAYGITTLGCAVVYPMVATVLINRPLTPREAYMGMGDCVVPFVGGWIVDAILPHDAWTDGLPPKPARAHHS